MVILGHFCPFTSLKIPKMKILKNEKICWRYHHFTCLPKITIIRCTIPEIWSERYRMIPKIKYFEKKKMPGHIIFLDIDVYHKWRSWDKDHIMIYGSWKIRCDRQEFSVILGHFWPFQPTDNLENQNVKIEKKHLEILFYIFPP